MDFRFGESATDAEDHAFTIIAPGPVGDERGAGADDPVDADFVVGGIKLERKLPRFVRAIFTTDYPDFN